MKATNNNINRISLYAFLTALSTILANIFNQLFLYVISIVLGLMTIYEFIRKHHKK